MDYVLKEHRNALTLVENNKKYAEDFKSLTDVIKSITDRDLISGFNSDRTKSKSLKSLSTTINRLIKERLVERGWNRESKIFRPADYKNGAWRLDFTKGKICVEVSFNHGEAAAHNIMKTILASEYNHVEKEFQSEIGVVIVTTSELKKAGNFDGANATIEKYLSYLKPYMSYATSPIVFIGLKAPKTFKIDKETRKTSFV